MKKVGYLPFVVIIMLLLASCDLFNSETDTAQSSTYSEPSAVHVTGITIEPTNVTLTIGKSRSLTCIVSPENATDKTVTWNTNAPSIVTVDQDGTIHAIGLGGAIITVTTNDGSIQAACMVVVSNPL